MAFEIFGEDIAKNESILTLLKSKNNNVLNNKIHNSDIMDFKDKNNKIFTATVETQYANLRNEDIVLLNIKDISHEIQTQNRINQLAYYDNLTSLPNRTLFEDRITHAIANAKRENETVALMFIDLDNFKIINDTLGHKAGDTLLKKVGTRIKSLLRENDTLSRIGGDEFTLIIENIPDKLLIVNIAKKIIAALEKPFILEGKEAFTAASIGICLYPDDADNISDMMRKADTAMYKVKELGKNSFEFFTNIMNKDALEQLEMISDIKKALDTHAFELHYQPKVCFKTGEILGVEALIRWLDPVKGFISPEIFITVAEKSGLMGRVEEFVLNAGALQQLAWQEMGINIQMSLNISNHQFNKSNFIEVTTAIFKKHNIDPSTIDLELTERIVMGSQESFDKIKALKEYGFNVSLDDFGTGQSSLSYLKKYNIDTLKIDKSFIDDIPDNEQSCSIATAIISLAKAMNMKTVAEGVEDEEQLKFLQKLGCDTYQGWYFSKALPAKNFEELYFR
jgi:diguanylate cyclase (GGDEF)-like protein